MATDYYMGNGMMMNYGETYEMEKEELKKIQQWLLNFWAQTIVFFALNAGLENGMMNLKK